MVEVEQYPEINFSDSLLMICFGDTLKVPVNVSPQGVYYNYSWTPASFFRFAESKNNINYFYGPQGAHTCIVTVSTPKANCTQEKSVQIKVHPEFNFLYVYPIDTLVEYAEEVQITTESESISWIWTPTDYLDNAHIGNPVSKPLKDIIYTVVGTNENNCKAKATVKIEVNYTPQIFVPNAFSPNGDGINDVFMPLNIRFEELETFSVFNRYGSKIYETANPNEGWNGTINGRKAEVGVYFWYLKAKLPDGSKYELKGDVTLLK